MKKFLLSLAILPFGIMAGEAQAGFNDPNYDWNGNAEALCRKLFQGRTMGMNMGYVLQGAMYTTKHPEKLQHLYYLSSQKCPQLWY